MNKIFTSPIKRSYGTKRAGWLVPTVILATASIGLASCGSSSNLASSTKSTSTTVNQKARAAYASCLKSHGFSFPKYNPGSKNPPTTVSPSVRNAAVAACANLKPSGGGQGFASSKSQQQALAAYTACLKSHGVSIPSSGSASGPGSFRTLSQSPAFASASKACASLRPSFGGRGGNSSGRSGNAPTQSAG